MRFLPIVERELRVAARQRKTWWRRVLTLGAALVVFGFMFLVTSQWATPSLIGRQVFSALSSFGLLYGLLAGPLATVDCLSRERREDTLGLLFLTDLRSYDVVLGKMAAASLDMVLGLAAVLPLLTLPLLMGGVNLAQFGYVALALVNVMFLSLATGVCASALLVSARASLIVTVAFLFYLTVGLPFLGEEVLGLRVNRPGSACWYMFWPVWGLMHCLRGMGRPVVWQFWLNMGAMHGLAWALVAIACVRTRTSWRNLSSSGAGSRWTQRFRGWRKGSARWRLAWRRFMLDKNPVEWLEGRDWLQTRVLWAIILAAAGFVAIAHHASQRSWPGQEEVVLWPLFSHYILCLWITVEAPRRLADDKESGALELLLCTPIQPRQIVDGVMRTLRRRFGGALLAMLALDTWIACAYFDHHGGWQGFLDDRDFPQLAACATVVFPVQVYSLAWVGLYQGLAQANSLRATFSVVWRVGLLPWVMFLGLIVACEIDRRNLRILPRIDDQVAFASWVISHLLACGVFVAQASWHLRRNFRALAASSTRRGWWKR